MSNDTFDHQFLLDVNNDKVPSCLVDKCSPYFDTVIQYTFLVDLASGTYTYYCALYRDTMHGWFVVQGDGTSNSSGGGYSYGSGSNNSGILSPGFGTLANWANNMSAILSGRISSRSTVPILLAIGLAGILAALAIVADALYQAGRQYL